MSGAEIRLVTVYYIGRFKRNLVTNLNL